MCHLKKKRANAFKEQTVLPRALLAHHSDPDPALQATVIEKHRAHVRENMFFTPRPLMLLKALLLQALVTGHVGATDLTHSVLEAA